MTTCQSCGSEVTGPVCPSCGALVQEERPAKPVKQPTKPAKAGQSAARSVGRIWRIAGVAVACLAIFGAGIVTGFYLEGRKVLAGSGDAAAVSADDANMPPSVLGGKYMDQGAQLMSSGKNLSAMATFRRAVTQFGKALAENPDDLYAKSYLGLTYFYIGDDKQSFGILAEVLKKDPNYLWAIFNLAWMDESTGKTDDAIMFYQKYIDLAPQEKANAVKYAEQAELIDNQVESAKAAIAKLKGDGTK